MKEKDIMQTEIDTPCGKVRIGSVIRIDEVFPETSMTASGVDEQALSLNGKSGTVEHIGGGNLHGSWDTLAVLADKDRFTVISY